MQKLLLAPALLLVVGSGFAADVKSNEETIRQNVGIGLGTMIWSNVGTGLLPQICAATTNGTFGNQTFAVTTGTSNAKKYDGFVANPAVQDYVASNLDVLARDMAVGHGESLATLAELAGIPEAKRAAFYAATQTSFEQIFTTGDITAGQVVVNLDKVKV